MGEAEDAVARQFGVSSETLREIELQRGLLHTLKLRTEAGEAELFRLGKITMSYIKDMGYPVSLHDRSSVIGHVLRDSRMLSSEGNILVGWIFSSFKHAEDLSIDTHASVTHHVVLSNGEIGMLNTQGGFELVNRASGKYVDSMTYFLEISHRNHEPFDAVIPQDFDGLWGVHTSMVEKLASFIERLKTTRP